MPEGIKLLLQKGALAFPHPFKEVSIKLLDRIKEKAASLLLRQPSRVCFRCPLTLITFIKC